MAQHGNMRKTAANARKARERNRRFARLAAFVIAVALAFAGGFALRGQTALL